MSAEFILDMVHHNPGEAPFQSKFLDAAFLESVGYRGQVFKHLNAAAAFDRFDPEIFAEGSPEETWRFAFERGLRGEIRQAKAQGLQVFYHLDLFVLPRRLVEKYRAEITDPVTGKISLSRDLTLKLHRILFEELAERFPDVDGYIIRVGETYLYDTPYHVGNGPIPWNPAGPDQRERETLVSLLRFLRETVCAGLGKYLVFRTWDFGHFHALADYYLQVTEEIAPHPKLLFSIKHTAQDFWRWLRFNDCLGIGRHRQVVEVQSQREYEGKGAYPNYVMHGVIHGFEEQKNRKGLHDLGASPLFAGVYGWSRGGGWYGPYIPNEFWCELNARVLARWAARPNETEESVFSAVCRDWLELDDENLALFRRLCLLSAAAILKGRYCEAWDRKGDDFRVPCNLWMRDDRLGGLGQLREIFEHLHATNEISAVLHEKRAAVTLWLEIESLANRIQFRDPRLNAWVRTSSRYGRRLFEIIRHGWEVIAWEFQPAPDIAELRRFVSAYDAAWAGFRSLVETELECASLYRGCYFNLPGEPISPGMDESVNAARARLHEPSLENASHRRRELYRLLGKLPARQRAISVVTREYEMRPGYSLERLTLDLNGREAVPAYYVRPLGREHERLPAILYNHWHGGDYALGKDGFISGMSGSPGLRPWAAEITALGFSGLCIDHWCFGERPSRQRGESAVFKDMLWRGESLWGHMVYDSLRALDWLAGRNGIAADRIGTLGMSMGSTMAWWLAALDTRVAFCIDICCLTEFDALIKAGNLDWHGVYYFVPGLLEHFKSAEINALIAPRPHLSVAGDLDEMTPPDGLDLLNRELRAVYARACAPNAWQLFRQNVGHVETPEMRAKILAFLKMNICR